jgi:precorrin-2 dehydrogenase/sirohydrochlorin ferrochelatase
MYPLCLEIAGKLCIIVGGGSVAERKASGLLAADARVRIISPQLSPGLTRLADDGQVQWLKREFAAGDLAGALLVFAATDSRQVQKVVVEEAAQAGQLVNVIDDPAGCSFQVPAVVRSGDLTLAVSTSGKSPAVAAMVRRQLEKEFGPEYRILLDLMARLREQELSGERACRERKILFQNILHDDIVLWIKNGQWDRLRTHLSSVPGIDVDCALSQLERDL